MLLYRLKFQQHGWWLSTVIINLIVYFLCSKYKLIPSMFFLFRRKIRARQMENWALHIGWKMRLILYTIHVCISLFAFNKLHDEFDHSENAVQADIFLFVNCKIYIHYSKFQHSRFICEHNYLSSQAKVCNFKPPFIRIAQPSTNMVGSSFSNVQSFGNATHGL